MDDEEYDLEEDTRSSNNESGMDKFMNFLKENAKLVIVVVVVILLLIIMSALSGGSTDNSGITISQQSVTVTAETGNQVKLMKDGKELTGVVWTSKDSSIATVDKSGVIKGIKPGKTTIVGKYNDKEYKCEVTVSEGDGSLKVESLKFSESGTILMSVGSTYQVPIQITPSEAKFKNKIFASSNPQIASIDINSGLITANSKGNAMIRVAVNDAEKMASIKIIVVEGQITPGIYTLPTSLAFDEKEITLTEGETKTLTYHQEPAEASTDYVMWVSADEEVATVFNGELIAKKPGNIEVAIVSMGLKDTMVVHVKSGTVPVTGVNITSETNITMNVGDQKKIIATVEPSNATNQVITYLVDNPSVVSVDSEGNISAIGSGSTTINVSPSANLDIKKSIYVTVNDIPTYDPPSGGGDSSGGSSSGGSSETPVVGNVIVSGTNNSVSTDVNGVEVESTIITMTGSGNVDEIRYCYYNKATSSSCSTKNIYGGEFELPQTTLSTKTTYVIKAVPYYQGQKGTEITRYVTIKPSSGGTNPPDSGTTPPDSGTTPSNSTIGYKVTSNNIYNNPGTANSNAKIGNQVVSFDIVNGGISYLKVCTGSNCTPTTKVIDNGTYTVTSQSGTMITVRVSEYNSKNELVRGPDNWYVLIKDASQVKNCYCKTNGECRWGVSGDGYTIKTSHEEKPCTDYINRGNKGCFLYKGEYSWGSHLADYTNYAYQSHIVDESNCGTQTQTSRCLVGANTQGISTNFVWTTDKASSNQVEAKALNSKSKCDGAKAGYYCFKDSSGKYSWDRNLAVNPNYEYVIDKTTKEACNSVGTTINEISYKIDSNGHYHFYCKSEPSSVCNSNNITWSSDNVSAFRFNANSNVGDLVSNSTVTITAKYGTAKFEKEYSLSNGGQISPAIYSAVSDHSYVVNYYKNDWARENYPMVAFSNIKGTYNFNFFDACYFTVRTGEKVSATDIATKCYTLSSQQAEEHTGRDILGLVGKYTTYKLSTAGVRYYTSNFSLAKEKQRVAFEFGWLTDRRNTGQDSYDVILIFYIGNSQSNIRSIKEYSRVYRISVTPKDTSWNNISSGKEDRFKDWKVTEETKKIFGSYYE